MLLERESCCKKAMKRDTFVVKSVDTKDLKSTYNNPHSKTNTLAYLNRIYFKPIN